MIRNSRKQKKAQIAIFNHRQPSLSLKVDTFNVKKSDIISLAFWKSKIGEDVMTARVSQFLETRPNDTHSTCCRLLRQRTHALHNHISTYFFMVRFLWISYKGRFFVCCININITNVWKYCFLFWSYTTR